MVERHFISGIVSGRARRKQVSLSKRLELGLEQVVGLVGRPSGTLVILARDQCENSGFFPFKGQ